MDKNRAAGKKGKGEEGKEQGKPGYRFMSFFFLFFSCLLFFIHILLSNKKVALYSFSFRGLFFYKREKGVEGYRRKSPPPL